MEGRLTSDQLFGGARRISRADDHGPRRYAYEDIGPTIPTAGGQQTHWRRLNSTSLDPGRAGSAFDYAAQTAFGLHLRRRR